MSLTCFWGHFWTWASGWVLTSFIVSLLKRAVAYAREVTQGNLEARIDIARNDEIGVLGQSMQDLVEDLQKKIAQANEQT